MWLLNFPNNIYNLTICNLRQLCQHVWKTRNGQNRTPGTLVDQTLTSPRSTLPVRIWCLFLCVFHVHCPCFLRILLGYFFQSPLFSMLPPYLVRFLCFPVHPGDFCSFSTARTLLGWWTWTSPSLVMVYLLTPILWPPMLFRFCTITHLGLFPPLQQSKVK